MNLDDSIQQITNIVKAACPGAEVRTAKISAEEARLTVLAPAAEGIKDDKNRLRKRRVCFYL